MLCETCLRSLRHIRDSYSSVGDGLFRTNHHLSRRSFLEAIEESCGICLRLAQRDFHPDKGEFKVECSSSLPEALLEEQKTQAASEVQRGIIEIAFTRITESSSMQDAGYKTLRFDLVPVLPSTGNSGMITHKALT